MLIAEDLLLLLTDDSTGKLLVSGSEVDIALGGANLVELTLMNKVDVTGKENGGKAGRIVVRDPAPVGDPVLDTALAIIAGHQGKKPSAVMTPLSKKLRHTLYAALVDKGVLRAERRPVLGVFATRRWPAQDANHEAGVRRLITQTLVNRATPDVHTAALVSLLHIEGRTQRRRPQAARHLEVRHEGSGRAGRGRKLGIGCAPPSDRRDDGGGGDRDHGCDDNRGRVLAPHGHLRRVLPLT